MKLSEKLKKELRTWYMVHVQGSRPGPDYKTTCDVEEFLLDMEAIFMEAIFKDKEIIIDVK